MHKTIRVSTVTVALCMLAILPAVSFADRPGDGHRHAKRDHGLRVLPQRHNVVHVGSRRYYYSNGRYYEPRGQSYFEVRAPIGARVH